jgi:hypothetical protein
MKSNRKPLSNMPSGAPVSSTIPNQNAAVPAPEDEEW